MTNFPLRLDEDFKSELKQIAKEEKRSLTKFIENVLEDYVDNYRAENRKNQKSVRVNLGDL